MAKTGPILILEDDLDDQEILADVFAQLGISNELKFFQKADDVLTYLRSTSETPFLILTDINLPGMSGLELRQEIFNDDHLRKKNIPYIFLSTSDAGGYLDKAYEMQVQGFFKKESTYEAVKKQIRQIVDYWKNCLYPDSLT